MRFSQRIGKRPVKTVLQVESMDTELRNRLWNVTLESFFNRLSYTTHALPSKNTVLKHIWKEFYTLPVDQMPGTELTIKSIRTSFFQSTWYEVYDFIEFIAAFGLDFPQLDFISECNNALKKEVSGYRIVNGQVVQITAEEEILEIEEALANNEWKSVQTHLYTALEMMADRTNPDYRNSIKESVSAVEALCAIITGDKNGTLGKALNEIEKKYALHSALKSAFSALYGYTSDAGGIRHALLQDSVAIGFEDAKFMLVSCSAFINYLKAKIGA